jgi:signal transduction histidine kinase
MKALLGAVAASCFVAVAILFLSWTTYFSQLNSTAYDFTLRLAGPVPAKSPTTIVAVDDESLQRIGAWPWSREKLAGLIDGIEAAKPRAIAVDLILDDKTSPDADQALASAIAKTRSIVLAAHLDAVNTERWRKPDAQFVHDNVRLGHVHTDPDFDGINRRILSAKATASGEVLRAFAVEALHAAGLPFEAEFERSIGPAQVFTPEPINIRFIGDNNSFTHVPAWKVLDQAQGLLPLADQLVLIGLTAEGLGDQWFTPFAETGKKMSGVEIHANAIDTLYAGRAIQQSGTDIVLFLMLIAFVLALWKLDQRYEGRRFYFAAVLTGPLFLLLAVVALKYLNFWLPFPPFWAALVVVLPGLEVLKIMRVNTDLDRKIERLSSDWLAALNWYEPEWPQAARAVERRAKFLMKGRRNSGWKLDAIDFFNEELMRFLSFNNGILASIEDVIIVSDPEGRVVYQNPAAKRLSGYRDHPGLASDYLAQVLDGRDFKIQPGTLHFVPSRDGKTFYNMTVAPISTAGVVFSLHDATAQQELNQAKSEMVSLVSHELRTPLTSIRGYSDMLLKYNMVEERGREFLQTILDESNRLNQLIQSFLDIAYIESGRQKITKSDFEIAPVLRDMFNVIGPVAAEKKITLEPPRDLDGMRVHADRLLLYQALTNLVTNAIKYSPSGTSVSIGVSNGNGAVRFRVSDQGYGIPSDEASRIFEKFYRRGNKETREQSGFGLGLTFVKEVAVRHGGDVMVESEVGKGSVFTLWIPL